MRRTTVSILGIAAVLVAVAFACSRMPQSPAPAPKTAREAAAEPAPGPGAFDVVKMDRFGTRMGPVYFAHALHADLPSLDGGTLPCAACHLEVCGTKRRCGECHVRRPRGAPGPPST